MHPMITRTAITATATPIFAVVLIPFLAVDPVELDVDLPLDKIPEAESLIELSEGGLVRESDPSPILMVGSFCSEFSG